MTFESTYQDALSIVAVMSTITAYTIYYTVSFTLSLFPLLLLGGIILGTIGGLEGIPQWAKTASAFGSIYLHCLTMIVLVVAQLLGGLDSSTSWLTLLAYSVGGICSLAAGLGIRWAILEQLGEVAPHVVDLLGLGPDRWFCKACRAELDPKNMAKDKTFKAEADRPVDVDSKEDS